MLIHTNQKYISIVPESPLFLQRKVWIKSYIINSFLSFPGMKPAQGQPEMASERPGRVIYRQGITGYGWRMLPALGNS